MIKKILIGICILLMLIGTVAAADRIQDVTTPYGTTCKLSIGGGINPDDTTVNEDGQKLAFNDGYKDCIFISTTKDVSDLIKSIESTGTKCAKDDVVWYHMKDQQLANSYSVFGGTHLKLENVNEYDIGFLKSPNSDETLILVAGPDSIVDCFKSVKWA